MKSNKEYLLVTQRVHICKVHEIGADPENVIRKPHGPAKAVGERVEEIDKKENRDKGPQ